jgi:hypothetical protein
LIFYGGANEWLAVEDVSKCVLCGVELGDSTDQHFLKCLFAHEELVRDELERYRSMNMDKEWMCEESEDKHW